MRSSSSARRGAHECRPRAGGTPSGGAQPPEEALTRAAALRRNQHCCSAPSAAAKSGPTRGSLLNMRRGRSRGSMLRAFDELYVDTAILTQLAGHSQSCGTPGARRGKKRRRCGTGRDAAATVVPNAAPWASASSRSPAAAASSAAGQAPLGRDNACGRGGGAGCGCAEALGGGPKTHMTYNYAARATALLGRGVGA